MFIWLFMGMGGALFPSYTGLKLEKSLWNQWDTPMDEIHRVEKRFVLANCWNPEIAALQFPNTT